MWLVRVVILTVGIILAAQASAQEQQKQLDRAIWVGNAYDRLNRTGNLAHWSSLNIISMYFTGPRKVTEDEGRSIINYFRWRAEDAYKTYPISSPTIDGLEAANSVYETLKDPTMLNAAGEFLKYQVKQLAASPDQQTKLWQSYNQAFYQTYSSRDFDKRAVLGKIWDKAQQDENFAKLFNEGYSSLLRSRTGDSAEKILDDNPEFASTEMLKSVVKGVGSVEERVKNLQRDINERLKSVANDRDPVKPQALAPEPVPDPIPLILAQQRDAQLAAQADFENRGLHSAAFVASHFISDPRTAKQFLAVANAIIDARALADQFSKIYTKDSVTPMATAAASFNYIALFFTVVDAFADKGPAPEQIILEQIQALAKLMQAFQDENRQRFNRIDAQLAAIFAAMNAQFQEVSTRLNDIDFDIQVIRGAMAQTLLRLDQIERSLTNYLALIADQSFGRTMKRCLGYRARAGIDLTERDYDDCVTSILSYIDDAKSPALAGNNVKGADANTFAAILAQNDTAAQVNFFLSLSAERGGYAAFERVPNPVRWAQAASYYATIAVENEKLFQETPVKALTSILDEGLLIDKTLSRELALDKSRFVRVAASLVQEYQAQARFVELAAAGVAQRAINQTAIATWLTPADLKASLMKSRMRFVQREIPIAGDWPVLEANWNANINPGFKDPSRGSGVPFKPLNAREHVWDLVITNPSLPALELLGLGRLELRYFPDVANAEVSSTDCCTAVWGEPFVTVFAYLVPSGAVKPNKPIALLPYRLASTTVTWADPCGGGVGPVFCKNLRNHRSVGGLPQKQFDWEKFLSTEQALARYRVVSSSSIPSFVEQRLDDLLSQQHTALRDEFMRQDSELYRAVSALDGTVNALRGLIAIALPGPSASNDVLRSSLYGGRDTLECVHVGSRVESEPLGDFSASSPLYLDAAKLESLEKPKREQASNPDLSKGEDCNSDNVVQANRSMILIDRRSVWKLLSTGLDKDAVTMPQKLNENNMLKQIGRIGEESGNHLLQVLGDVIRDVSYENNRHSFVRFEIERLKALINTRENKF